MRGPLKAMKDEEDSGDGITDDSRNGAALTREYRGLDSDKRYAVVPSV